jgi:guanine deaminase
MPGFIDAHVHLPQFDCVGVDGLTLLEWLRRAVFPAEARWADPQVAFRTAERACRRFLAAGTTGIAAYGTVHHEGTLAAVEAVRAAGGTPGSPGPGLRAMVGQVLMDQQAPEALTRPAKALAAEALQMAERVPPMFGKGWLPTKRVESAVTPRFAVSCSDELLRLAGGVARATKSAVQTHLSETTEECALVAKLHAGAGGEGDGSYTEVYRRNGLLGKRTVLGHGIWLSDAERRAVVKNGAVVAHCPTANVFLQAGTMDRAGHLRAGGRVALGSDLAGGPDVSMVRVARAMIDTAKHRRLVDTVTPVPSAAEAWAQITWLNGAALGWADTGLLAAGAWADLLVVNPERGPHAEAGWAGSVDPLSVLLYGWDERWIEGVVLGGRVV